MSNKFQELKSLRKSGVNFNENPDDLNDADVDVDAPADNIQNEDEIQYSNYNQKVENENPENFEMDNYNVNNIEEINQGNQFENENYDLNNAENYDANYNNNDEYVKDDIVNQNDYNNEANQEYALDDMKNKSKYSNYDMNDKNMMNGHTSRTIKSRIEIDADENNVIKKANIENEQNETKRKNKIFMTDYQSSSELKDVFSFHDLIIPNSKTAKICIIKDILSKNLRLTEIADHFQFYEPTPTIVLIGANTTKKVKLLAGLTRAALNTRATIIDSGLFTGMEKFCARKNINLIGIAPKEQIELPKISNEKYSSNTLSQGHSHFILLEKEGIKLDWGDDSKIKLSFAERMASGRKGFSYKCKMVGIILGNIPKCEEEIYYFVEKNLPLILVDDSELSSVIRKLKKGENIRGVSEKLKAIASYRKLIDIQDNSEHLASAVHISLTLAF